MRPVHVIILFLAHLLPIFTAAEGLSCVGYGMQGYGKEAWSVNVRIEGLPKMTFAFWSPFGKTMTQHFLETISQNECALGHFDGIAVDPATSGGGVKTSLSAKTENEAWNCVQKLFDVFWKYEGVKCKLMKEKGWVEETKE